MKFYVLKSCEHYELIKISDFCQLCLNLYLWIIQCDRSILTLRLTYSYSSVLRLRYSCSHLKLDLDM